MIDDACQYFFHKGINFNKFFEFGSPIKVDMMMHSSKDMSLAESGDKEGGLEVGLMFKKEEFEYFYSLMEQGLEALKL